MLVSNYTKAIVSVIAAGIAVLIPTLGDNTVDAAELVNVIIAIVTAVGVYVVPYLKSDGSKSVAKTIVAFAGAALVALVNIFGGAVFHWGDVTLADWLSVLLAGLGAIGVYILPNVDAGKDYVGPGLD